MDPPTRWFNWVVWLSGGRDGVFGHFYVPTLIEEADDRHRALERRHTELEMAREDAQRTLAADERRARALWADDKCTQARALAKRMARVQRNVRRLDAHLDTIDHEMHEVADVRAGDVVRESLAFRVRAGRERAETMSPQHVRAGVRVLQRMRSHDTAADNALHEMYRESDEAIDNSDDDERDEDDAERVLEAMGLARRVDEAPAPPATEPGVDASHHERPFT